MLQMSGWIKLDREITSHWIFEDSWKFRNWIDLLTLVNHSEQKVNIKGTVLTCNRGETLCSLDTFAKRWNCDKSKVRRFLKLLEADSMIVLKSEHITTRLTICNYDTYQGERNADETQVKHKRNADETQVTPNNNDNKEKKERSIFKAPSLEELNTFCLENNLELNASDFLNYYDSNGWMVGKNKMKDWKATVRRWSKPKQEYIYDPLVEKARRNGYIK
jgi:DNA replication protein DnaD